MGVISRVISSTELKSEESEHFISSNSIYDLAAVVKTRLSKSEEEVEEPKNHKTLLLLTPTIFH